MGASPSDSSVVFRPRTARPWPWARGVYGPEQDAGPSPQFLRPSGRAATGRDAGEGGYIRDPPPGAPLVPVLTGISEGAFRHPTCRTTAALRRVPLSRANACAAVICQRPHRLTSNRKIQSRPAALQAGERDSEDFGFGRSERRKGGRTSPQQR